MEVKPEHSAEEIKRLHRCMNDLVSVLALPAIWSGGEPSQIVRTLLDVLLSMLHLDLVYVRLNEPANEAPIEMVRFAPTGKLTARPQEIGELLSRWLGDDSLKWPAQIRNRIGDRDISIVPLRLGIGGEIGFIVAGSQRANFPEQTERLLLSVAANQAAIGLQGARLLSETKRGANELEQRVAQRTAELAAANEELQLQVGLLQQSQEELRRADENTRLAYAPVARTIACPKWSPISLSENPSASRCVAQACRISASSLSAVTSTSVTPGGEYGMLPVNTNVVDAPGASVLTRFRLLLSNNLMFLGGGAGVRRYARSRW